MQRGDRHLIRPSTFRRMLNMVADDQHQDGPISSEGATGVFGHQNQGGAAAFTLESLFQIGKQ